MINLKSKKILKLYPVIFAFIVAILSYVFIDGNDLLVESNQHPEQSSPDIARYNKPIMTFYEKQEIANNLLLGFQKYDLYFQTHSFDDMTRGKSRIDYFQNDVLEFVYNTTKLYDYYIGLTGIFRDAISVDDFNKCINTNRDWFFSDRIKYGYTESGAHIIAILPVESNDTSLWFDSINKVRGDPNENYILNPIDSIIDIYVEDLTKKAQAYDISIRIKGFAAYVNDENIGNSHTTDIDFFPTRTNIPDKVRKTMELYGRDIDTKSIIKDRTWKLFMVDKGDYDRFWSLGVEITLDGEIIQLQP